MREEKGLSFPQASFAFESLREAALNHMLCVFKCPKLSLQMLALECEDYF